MTGDAAKAQEIFQDTLREAAFHSANREPPPDRYWFFRQARWRCLNVTAQGVQPEVLESNLADVSEQAPEPSRLLEPAAGPGMEREGHRPDLFTQADGEVDEALEAPGVVDVGGAVGGQDDAAALGGWAAGGTGGAEGVDHGIADDPDLTLRNRQF